MKDRIQPIGAIQTPDDVEEFDIEAEFNRFVGPSLDAAGAWLTDKGAPYIYITTLRVERRADEQGNVVISGAHNIRGGNLNVVRDYALCFAHEAIAAKDHIDLGTRFAELAAKSPGFLEAFFAHLEKKGLLSEVQTGPLTDEDKPVTH